MCIRDRKMILHQSSEQGVIDKDETEMLRDVFRFSDTVSYTHLDVYKRQAFDKLRRMTYLESHLHLFLRSLPGIIRNEMKIVHTEFIAVLQCRITSAGHRCV